MKKLPGFVILGLLIGFNLIWPQSTYAVVIAQQNQNWGNQLNVWQTIQELGNNLNGPVGSFTFRVSTAGKTNLQMFDYTVQNVKIYDKDAGSTVIAVGCASNASETLSGLTFTTAGVPTGFEDVTINFSSCNNYSFILGHKYLIKIGNANNVPFSGGKFIQFAAAAYETSGNDYFTGGGLRYAFDNKICFPAAYIWNSPTADSGCNVWTTSKDDLYFVLTNTTPEPVLKTPVIFIPGIGGSEFKASEKIFWVDADDGHGGKYSHGYEVGEKIWVNQDEAAKLGDDDYFDVLRLKTDGKTPEAPSLSLTGSLTPFGYGDIEPFFTDLGYEKDKNFFNYPYDWRKDVRENKDELDNLIETAKQKSGKDKVDLVAHSMGGLVARYYISDSEKAKKVGKLIELGVPHLGAVDSLKTLRYGSWLGYDFKLFTLGIPPSETKDGAQNMSSMFEILPSSKYYDFYDSSTINLPFPVNDERDLDNNKEIGPLNFMQLKTHLSNLGHNTTTLTKGEEFHNIIDPILNDTKGVKTYIIAGSNQPTLGQLHETWWVTWPINLISRTEEIYINGDGTVPLYSASLKSADKDLTGGATLYYTEQEHSDLVKKTSSAMLAVKSILNETAAPVEVKSEKIDLEGQHLSLDDGELELYDDSGNHTGLKDNGEIETNIANTFYSTSGKTKHAFIKKNSPKVQVKITRKTKAAAAPTNPSLKIRRYKQDKIDKTILYKDLPVKETTLISFDLDPISNISPTLPVDNTVIQATSEISGSPALDQTPPKTKIDVSGSVVTLTGSDEGSGILRIEYSLDNGKTVQVYKDPFTLSSTATIQVKAIDKLGNEEIPQQKTVEIASSTSSSSSSNSSSSNNSSSENTPEVKSSNTSEKDKITSIQNTSDGSEGRESSGLPGGSVSEAKADSSEVEKATSIKNTSKKGLPVPSVVEGDSFEVSKPQEVLGINNLNNLDAVVKQTPIINQLVQHLGGLLIVFVGLQGMLPVFSASLLTFFKPTPK